MKILPCPFCGAAPKSYRQKIAQRLMYHIQCENDEGCDVSPGTIAFTRKGEAVEMWNRRFEYGHE